MSDKSKVIEKLRQASEEFVGKLLDISHHYHPRGGQPFPQEVVDILGYDCVVAVDPILDVAKQHMTTSGTLLDFGCGNGPYREIIKGAGFRYVGLDYDVSSDPATLLRKGTDFDNEVVTYDGLDTPFEDNSFAAVLAWSSLEHCIHPEKSISEIARVLKPGGVLVGSVPHLMPYHAESVINFTPYGFYTACKRNGLKAVRIIPNLDPISFAVKNLALALGIVDEPNGVDGRFRWDPIINPLLDRFTESGHQDWLKLSLHAEMCAEFGFIAVKP